MPKRPKKKKASEVRADQMFKSSTQEPLMMKLPEFTKSFGRIVETTFELVDPEKIYDELIGALNSGSEALTPGTIRKQLAEAPRLQRLSHQLYVVARHDAERFANSQEVVMATLREAAKTQLEEDKAAGKLKKAITDKDVTSMVAQAFPDEFTKWNDAAIQARKTVEHLKAVHDTFKQRIRVLCTLAGTHEEL